MRAAIFVTKVTISRSDMHECKTMPARTRVTVPGSSGRANHPSPFIFMRPGRFAPYR